MSKKDKMQTINNIKELNLEIDYDKLAEAIVKAQNKANDEPVPDKKQKTNFFKGVWYIITNKKQLNESCTAVVMGSLISLIFNVIAILSVVIFAVAIVVIIQRLIRDETSITYAIVGIIFSVNLPLIGLILRACANEMSREKNRDYIVAVFSGITGFIALVAAIIALIK